MALPTKEQFLANQISVIQDCGICQQNFDMSEHAPARLCGPDSCHHVFGASCLTKWLESDMPCANKCPMCRKELFVSENEEYISDDESGDEEDDEPIILDELAFEDDEDAILGRGDGMLHTSFSYYRGSNIERDADNGEHAMEIDSDNYTAGLDNVETERLGEDSEESDLSEQEPRFCDGSYSLNEEEDSLRMIRHRPDAAAIIKRIWKSLYDICCYDVVFDDEIELQIHRGLRHTDPSDHTGTLIWSNQWPNVLKVAREMICQHRKNRKFAELSEHDILDWIESMEIAIGWSFCGVVDACSRYDYGSGRCTGKYGDRW